MKLDVKAAYPNAVPNHVVWASDGKAWTTDPGDQTVGRWPYNSKVVIQGSHIPTLKTGQHFYEYEKVGVFNVESWVVVHWGQCIHPTVTFDEYHGHLFNPDRNGEPYYTGWVAICADCGGKINDYGLLIYMSQDTAKKIDKIEVGTGIDYYYACPFCDHLEQGADLHHTCKAISYNQYRIVYDPNAQGGTYAGYMPSSYHMYNNATEYDGKAIKPNKNLLLNQYSRTGYKFLGWSTKPDGLVEYTDGQEIKNLGTKDVKVDGRDEATVTLYAIWQKNSGTLKIDANGGKYNGKSVEQVSVQYGAQVKSDSTKLVAPEGFNVTLHLNGGSLSGYGSGNVVVVKTKTEFVNWEQVNPFSGSMDGEVYTFLGENGKVDTLRANYRQLSVTIGKPTKTGASFGGWYLDSGFTKPVSPNGDNIIIVPTANMDLYANWADLTLVAKDNYTAYNGTGAVDLSWSQKDGTNKVYNIYQSLDSKTWTKIANAQDKVNEQGLSVGTTNKDGTYTVKYSGVYKIKINGAQGGNLGGYEGGQGGYAEAEVWLNAGDVLTYTIGKQNGTNFGGKGLDGIVANGGGATTVKLNREYLMIAGGGGGATVQQSGKPGGSTESLIDGMLGEGTDDSAGGGGGAQGGKGGVFLRHFHTEDCLHIHLGDDKNGGECYKEETTIEECTVTWSGPNNGGPSPQRNCPNCNAKYGYGTFHFVTWTPHHSLQNKYPDECSKSGITGAGYAVCSCGFEAITDTAWGGAPKTGCVDHHTIKVTTYTLDCDIVYICEYKDKEDGYVISSSPAYGGSNAINVISNHPVNNQVSNAGVNEGDGDFSIEPLSVGFTYATSLSAVVAKDNAKPDQIDKEAVESSLVSGNKIKVQWQKPQDNGTDYYHQVKSYLPGSLENNPLNVSNITKNTLTSGIRGYYYLINENKNQVLTTGSWTSSLSIEIDLTPYKSKANYLHLAPFDVAGNVGPTIDISLPYDNQDPGTTPDIVIDWPVHTKQLIISTLQDEPNIYKSSTEDKVWYVRSDGTPFELQLEAYLDGEARKDYQINDAIFVLDNTIKNIISCKNLDINALVNAGSTPLELSSSNYQFSSSKENALQFYPNTTALRLNKGKTLKVTQSFTIDSSQSGKRFVIKPQAIVNKIDGGVTQSKASEDNSNAITIIADSSKPQFKIEGNVTIEEVDPNTGKKTGKTKTYTGDIFEQLAKLDRRTTSASIVVSVEDTGSGLKAGTFSVTMTNKDNYANMEFKPEADGKIRIPIISEDPVYNGDLEFKIVAEDNVGNTNEINKSIAEFSLESKITNATTGEVADDISKPVFKLGEFGILDVVSYGYADKVEIEIPAEIDINPNEFNDETHKYEVGLDGKKHLWFYYNYTDSSGAIHKNPLYEHKEELLFNIPLEAPTIQYKFTIRAYKNADGKELKLEENPSIEIFQPNGTVSDGLGTHIKT